jgi:hypothetical protein
MTHKVSRYVVLIIVRQMGVRIVTHDAVGCWCICRVTGYCAQIGYPGLLVSVLLQLLVIGDIWN